MIKSSKFLENIFGQLNGPRYTVNMRLHLRNIFVFKSIYCQHYGSCWDHMLKGIIIRFIKGIILHFSFKYLLSFLQELDMTKKRNFFQRLMNILFSYDIQVINSGIYSALFGAAFRMLNCIQRHLVFEGKKSKIIYLISAIFTSLLLTPIFFGKSYRKLLMFFALSLSFDCLFKLIFS